MSKKLLKLEQIKDKTRFGLLHPKALREIAKVFTHGAKIYSPWNWLDCGDKWSVYYDAAQRHLNDYWDRNDYDTGPKGSGLLHLAHAGACIIILLVWQMLKVGEDDRPKT